nr:hypothetical protein NG677_04330 [Methylobacterium sp. OTU13CASTA1]
MNVYAVRHAPGLEHAPLEAVGIVVATSLEELRYLVDQVGDPNICEYAPLGVGGIMWSGRGPTLPLMPTKEHLERFRESEGEAGHEDLFKGAELDECWMGKLYGWEKLNWRPLVGAKNGWLPAIGLLPDNVEPHQPLRDQI